MTRGLLIFTSADKVVYKEGWVHTSTGYYLPEAAHPYYVFKKAGYELDFASPEGANPPVDQSSVQAFAADQGFLEDPDVKAKLAATKKITDVKAADYDFIFYVGGHGPLQDLVHNEASAKLASEFYQAGKITAAVCHGTAALALAKDASGKSIFAGGKRFTGFSNTEEKVAAGDKYSQFPYLLEDELTALGGKYESGPNLWGVFSINDGNLYTGQNPASAEALAESIVNKLG